MITTFARLYKPGVVVTLAGQTATSLGMIPGGVDPRIVFRVKRTLTSTPDTAEVGIYGLAPERRTAMQALFGETGRSVLTIAAGFEGVTIPVFRGDVRKMRATDRDGGDFVTRAWADDAGDAIAEARIPAALSSTAGLTAQQMIDVALACFAAPQGTFPGAVIAPDASVGQAIATATPGATTTFYASVQVGKARDLLDEAARTLGVRWWIRDNQLFMARRGLPVGAPALASVLLPDHLLEEPSDDGSGLTRIVAMFDPNIQPGLQVNLVGRVAPGVTETFRAEACEYAGDVESSAPWSVTIDARSFGA